MSRAYLFVIAACVANMFGIYFLRASEGMTRLWSSIGLVVCILAAQWLMSRAMMSGSNVAPAVAAAVVAVMLSGVVVGALFGERQSAVQLTGVAIAIGGVILANASPFFAKQA
jgi:multidrug transporter EmrE-like cation transporter